MSPLLITYLVGFAATYGWLYYSILRRGVEDTSRSTPARPVYVVSAGNWRGALAMSLPFSLAWPVLLALVVLLMLLVTLQRWVKKGEA